MGRAHSPVFIKIVSLAGGVALALRTSETVHQVASAMRTRVQGTGEEV